MANDNGNGNGNSGWRWTIGILLTIQGAILGWVVVQLDDVRNQIYANNDRSTRQILDERTQTWVPVIVENRADLIRMDKELNRLKDQVEYLQRVQQRPR